jgi:hypothetical protein
MSNEKNIRIVKGDERYQGSQNKDESIQLGVLSDRRNYIEGNRNLALNLQDQFDFERGYSNFYRLYGKIDVLYDNIISGSCKTSNTSEWMNNMYLIPEYIGCLNTPCDAYPPSMLFEFIPEKRYGPVAAGVFMDVTAYQDNWVTYISYVYSHDSQQDMMMYYDYTTDEYLNFDSGDGIPFIVSASTINGNDILQFVCPVDHGLTTKMYFEIQNNNTITTNNVSLLTDVTISTTYPGPITKTSTKQIFKVDFLGNGNVGMDSKVFNVIMDMNDSISSLGGNTYGMGTFKRIINPDNISETRSEYYVHQHKLITNSNEYVLDRTGFENGIFPRKGRVYKAKRTPNNVGKTVIKEEFKSYLWNCDKDIDRDEYYDNRNRPITELYLSIFQTNRNGVWDKSGNRLCGYGWSWNFTKVGVVDPYVSNSSHPANIVHSGTWADGIVFPIEGDVFRGAFVEYNPYELEERILSEIGHSLDFRQTKFETDGSIYKYQPHHRIPIRKLSTSITRESKFEMTPQYARYLVSEGVHRWRNMLPIGIYEEGGNGVSYPYLNDTHYPYLGIEFLIEAIRINHTGDTITMIQQFGDVCE